MNPIEGHSTKYVTSLPQNVKNKASPSRSRNQEEPEETWQVTAMGAGLALEEERR